MASLRDNLFDLTGYSNVAIGAKTLYNSAAGSHLIAIGDSALYHNLGNDGTGNGLNNIAVGRRALYNNTTGGTNYVFGSSALYNNTTGGDNYAFGNAVLNSNTNGSFNCGFGDMVLYNNDTGWANTSMGNSSLRNNTSGYQNTALGEWAGSINTTGYQNTFIGNHASAGSSGLNNATALGAYAQVSSSNSLVLGGTGTNAVNVGIGVPSPTHGKLEISGSVGAVVGMFGVDKQGVAIMSDFPEIGFNYFYNGGYKTFKPGYASMLGMDTTNGEFYIRNFNNNQSVSSFGSIVSIQDVLRIKQNGNVGLGTTTPINAKLQVEGMTGNTVAYFCGTAGTNRRGVSIVADEPGIYFNCYWNGNCKAMSGGGYPAVINVDQSSLNGGAIRFYTTTVANTLADVNNNAIERMRIGATGEVAIGTVFPTAGYKLTVAGSAIASGGTWVNSDARYKKNVAPINNALESVLKLQGVTYDYKAQEFPQWNFDNTKQIGVIAQEVEKVMPELVKTGDDGYKAVSYEKFTPVLIEAIKEQQKQIEVLKAEIEKLKNK